MISQRLVQDIEHPTASGDAPSEEHTDHEPPSHLAVGPAEVLLQLPSLSRTDQRELMDALVACQTALLCDTPAFDLHALSR